MDGAVHVCQTMGVCDAFRSGRYLVVVVVLSFSIDFFKRKVLIDILRYTCEECVQGLEWVENYIEDPIMIAEYVVYLEQNFCQGAT